MNKQLTEYVITHCREKSRFTTTDRSGIEFRVGNVICDGKIYFVVSANGKIVECMEITTEEDGEWLLIKTKSKIINRSGETALTI